MGPNLHSHQPCIKWKLDLGALEERPSNVLPGFVDNLMTMIPSLIEHRCSEGVRGGFRTRLDLGTWMGHVMEHVALELQNLAGIRVGFGRARSAGEYGVYNVVYQCEERETGLAAGELALDLIEHLVAGESFPFEDRLAAFRALHARTMLDPSTQVVVDAAKARGIPVFRIEDSDLVQLGQGELARRVAGASTSLTSHLAVQLAADPLPSRSILARHGVPVPADCTVPGHEFRLLVIDGRFVVAARRVPASPSASDIETTSPPAVDVTGQVHPSNVSVAERVAALIGSRIAGVDIVAERIDLPLDETGGSVVNVTAEPDLSVHAEATGARQQTVGESILSMIFPLGAKSRIPVLSVTGTNGKTTTARLCAHIALEAGFHVGLATTDGIYIRNRHVLKGDLTGPQSAGVVLQDPAVNFAVLETARGGILRAGLGYDWSDVAVVTNIAEDHLGLRGIHTIKDLARVKAVTVERVFRDGYAVLNAEDAMTPLILGHADCRIALFALDPRNPELRRHIEAGGLGVTVENEEVVVYDNASQVSVAALREVPITFEGRARFNVANVLAAVAASWAMDLELEAVRTGIRTFFPSMAQTPGRTNFIEFDGFTVVIDYAHNPHGVAAMAEFVRALAKRRAVATIAVPGDRRDSDIEAVATIAASAFDEVILREDYHTRGRQRGEVAAIMRRAMLRAGFDEKLIHVRTDELGALELGLELCREGDLFLYFADKVEEATRFLEQKRLEKAGEGRA